MIWLDTKTQAEADDRQSRMWETVWTETEDGGMIGQVRGDGLYEGERFWADAIKDTHGDPAARLAMAKRNLPLPAAFREAAIALRAIIRAKKKAGQDFEAELRELHHWAAIQSIAGYDLLDITPFSEIEPLDLQPATIGWDQLTILNQTDRKWMVERWPTPSRHTTGAALYPRILDMATKQLERQREADMARSLARLDAMLAAEPLPPQPSQPQMPAPRGFFARLFMGHAR